MVQSTGIPEGAQAAWSERWMQTWARVEPHLRRIGAIAALAQAAVFILILILNATVYSGAHLNPATDLRNPARLLPAVAHAPLGFIALSGTYVLLGVTVALLSLALYELLGPDARGLTLPATGTGLLAALLFIVLGLFGMIRLPMLASDYVRHPVTPDRAFTTYLSITTALLSAAIVVLGVWFLTTSWAAMRYKALGRGLAYLGLAWGVLALLSPVEDTSLFLLGELLWLVWAIWIGFVLLRPPAAREPVADAVGLAAPVNGTTNDTPGPSEPAEDEEP